MMPICGACHDTGLGEKHWPECAKGKSGMIEMQAATLSKLKANLNRIQNADRETGLSSKTFTRAEVLTILRAYRALHSMTTMPTRDGCTELIAIFERMERP